MVTYSRHFHATEIKSFRIDERSRAKLVSNIPPLRIVVLYPPFLSLKVQLIPAVPPVPYAKLGASYFDGMDVDATGSAVDRNALDVNLSKHRSPKIKYAKEQIALSVPAKIRSAKI